MRVKNTRPPGKGRVIAGKKPETISYVELNAAGKPVRRHYVGIKDLVKQWKHENKLPNRVKSAAIQAGRLTGFAVYGIARISCLILASVVIYLSMAIKAIADNHKANQVLTKDKPQRDPSRGKPTKKDRRKSEETIVYHKIEYYD